MKEQINISEKTYLSALKNDDVAAFDKLFSEYGKRLYHFAYGYLKSKEEAEGVVQEVFLKIWRNRKQLKPDLSFNAYLFKIAYHHILELFEQINRRQAYRHQIIDEAVSFTDETNDRLNYQILLEKVESVYNENYHDQNQAKLSLFRWIETWYNRNRRHSALGYKTIEEFEILNINQKIAA